MAAPLSPLDAYDQVMRFAAARGEDALRLAMHASVPQVIRPELLHLLRLNFVPEASDDPALEADVLLAPFCEHLGNGYYRFDAHARRHLVRQLDPLYGRGLIARSQRVAGFLLSYFDEQSRVLTMSNDSVHVEYVEVERWVALAFFDPQTAARQLASAVKRASEADPTGPRFRLAGLSAAMTTPLAQHQTLLAYAGGVEAIQRGDLGTARDLLEGLGDREIAVGDVTLRSAHAVLSERMRPRPETETDIEAVDEFEEAARSVEPASQAPERVARSSIFISYSHKDRKWLELLRTFLQPIVAEHDAEIWDDSAIHAGDDWSQQISRAMERARVAILLISPDYLASNFVMKEQWPALERAVHGGELTLLWIPLRACAWERTPIAKFQSLLDPRKPLASLTPAQRDRSILKVAETVDKVLRSNASPPAEAAPDIFLCYRRGTDDRRVNRLADDLDAAFGGKRVFRDISSIEPGQDFFDVIRQRVESSSAMLVVIAHDWLGRATTSGKRRIDDNQDVLRMELAAALSGSVRVIPVLLGGASMPAPHDLPPDLTPLTRRQAIRLGDQSWERDFEALKRSLQRIQGHVELPATIYQQRPALTITPTQLFIVIGKDAAGPVFNMDCRLANSSRRSAIIHRLAAELTDPFGSSFRMHWNLFYEYDEAAVMQKTGDPRPITLESRSDLRVGIQFTGPRSARDYAWPTGEYRFDLLGWLSADSDSDRPDFARRSLISVDQRVSKYVKEWVTASDAKWRELNDPHNAVAISVSIRGPQQPG